MSAFGALRTPAVAKNWPRNSEFCDGNSLLISEVADLSRNLGVSRQGSPLQSWTQIEMADFASMRDCETPFHFRIFKLDLINIEALLNAFKRQSF